ncbi:MAG: hypothetical protein U1F08_12245 [Steroidobacteraceae bacterium]
MSAFEYASILLSIVVSLALAHLLHGVAAIIKAGVARWSSIVAAWNLYAAILCVDYWFSIWHVRAEPVWSLGFVVFLLLLGSALYLTCHVAMPDTDHGRPVDMVGFRGAHARRYLPAFFVYQAAGSLANLALPGFQSTTMQVLSAAQLAVLAVAWWRPTARVQGWALVLLYVLFAYYAVTFIPAL